jgi:hypothetical protein
VTWNKSMLAMPMKMERDDTPKEVIENSPRDKR